MTCSSNDALGRGFDFSYRGGGSRPEENVLHAGGDGGVRGLLGRGLRVGGHLAGVPFLGR